MTGPASAIMTASRSSTAPWNWGSFTGTPPAPTTRARATANGFWAAISPPAAARSGRRSSLPPKCGTPSGLSTQWRRASRPTRAGPHASTSATRWRIVSKDARRTASTCSICIPPMPMATGITSRPRRKPGARWTTWSARARSAISRSPTTRWSRSTPLSRRLRASAKTPLGPS